MSDVYVGKRRREDGVEPSPLLGLALETRRAKQSTSTRTVEPQDGAR